jgi:hypothetical protein
MSILKGHHILKLTPINANEPTPHRTIMLHEPQPYDPPTVHNNATFSTNTNRPNASTPTAFIYHLRYGCAGEQVLKRTQPHVIGMNVQLGSWKTLQQKLPCDACLAGKMRKTRKASSSAFTPVQNLALSWTPATTDKVSTPNVLISTDWGIINKTAQQGKNNVFALYLDLNTGWLAVYPKENRGLAGETLQEYYQEHGIPGTILHDNAQEYLHGDFATLCQNKGIKQQCSAPYNPNQNPTEHYMDIVMGKTRSLLYMSGLDPLDYWEHALLHGTNLQNRIRSSRFVASSRGWTPSRRSWRTTPSRWNPR